MGTSRRKICLVSTSPILSELMVGKKVDNLGGAEVQQTIIAKMLLENGYDVCVLVHDIGQPNEMTTPEGLRLIKAYGKPSRFFTAMKRAGADVYYQRGGGSITGLIAIICRILGKKFIFATSTDMDLDGVKEKGMNSIKRAIFRYGINTSTVVIQTDEQHENLKKRFRKQGTVIRNSYSVPEETTQRKPEYVIWVASFRDLKRPEMFVDLAEKLPEHQFLMVGGPYVHQPEIFDQIKERSASIPNIKLTGIVPYNEVGKQFDKAKLLICTSTIEGFPNTFLQAWSRGIPIVSTVDPDRLIERLELGRHCSTVDEMVSAVRKILSDESLRIKTGEKAADYVKNNHHPDAISIKYIELIDSLLK